MKKIFLTGLVAFLVYKPIFAQRYFALANSNYAGINGLYINPANIVDNRLMVDVHLASVNINGNQSYGYIKNYGTLRKAINNNDDLPYTKGSNSTVGYNALGEGRGPSFMFQYKKKHAFGVLTRARIVGSGTGINTDYFILINDGIRGLKLPNGSTFNSGDLNINYHIFSELGIAYGREIYNKENKYLKAGIVVKHYNGLGFTSARLKNFSVKLIDTSTSKVEYNGSINGSQSNIKNLENLSSNNLIFGGPGSGFGIDIGAIYEYREAGEDDEKISTSRVENKYKYKIGFSFQDIGNVSYKASPDNDNFTINTNGPKIVNNADTANIGFSDITSYFKGIPGVTSTKDNNALKIKTPTTFTLFADYKYNKHLYLNVLFTGGLVGNNGNGTRTAFQAMITPRYESKLFDAGLPISFNGLSKDVKIGLGLRLGIFYIGTDDFLGSFTGVTKIRSANFYTGIHIGFPYKNKREKEEDDEPIVIKKIIIKETPKIEPKVAAPIDTDNDGIIDTEDRCPTVKGIIAFAGCPDTDSDGIEDSQDDCPTVKGLTALRGCPDTDGDGVPDKDDKCIDTPGPIDNNGCPRVTEVVKKKLDYAASAIQFEVNKDIIQTTSYSQLDEVVAILNEYNNYQLIIDGHTDNTGTAAKNKLLSDKRAAAIKNYIALKGIDTNRLIATGYGDTKPLVLNNTAANKAKNRRVALSMKLKD